MKEVFVYIIGFGLIILGINTFGDFPVVSIFLFIIGGGFVYRGGKIEKSKSADKQNKPSSKSFKVKYLGGIDRVENGKIKLKARKDGVLLSKSSNSSNYVIKWNDIKQIDDKRVTKSQIGDKVSATAIGLLTGSKILTGAGLFMSDEEEKHLLQILFYDKHGNESEALFETKDAQKIKLKLNEKRTMYSEKEEAEEEEINEDDKEGYLEELEKLAELREKGIVTEQEFEDKKEEILFNESEETSLDYDFSEGRVSQEKEGEFDINVIEHDLAPVFEKLEEELESFDGTREICLEFGLSLEKSKTDYKFEDELPLGFIKEGRFEDVVLLFNDFFLVKKNNKNILLKGYYDEVTSIEKFGSENPFKGKYEEIELSEKELGKLKEVWQ